MFLELLSISLLNIIADILVKFGSEVFEPLHSIYGYKTKNNLEVKQTSVNVRERSCAVFAPITLLPSQNLFSEIPADVSSFSFS